MGGVIISYDDANVIKYLLSKSLKDKYEMLDRFKYKSSILVDDIQKRINVEEKLLSKISFGLAVNDLERILRND